MTFAVTAVSGQLGREIARKLMALPGGAPVIGLARTPAKVTDLGVEVRPGDYDQSEQLHTSLDGVDALVIVRASTVAATSRRSTSNTACSPMSRWWHFRVAMTIRAPQAIGSHLVD